MRRRKKQEVYYALSGSNAYGIFNNYEKAIASRLYVTKSNIKKFYDFEDAKENSGKYVEDFFAALGSSKDNADSSRFKTE